MTRRVIFIADSFQEVSTGPGTYANILWEEFANDSDVDFHLVTVGPAPEHPKIHPVLRPAIPARVYAALQETASSLMENPSNTLFHANSPQLAFNLFGLGATVAVQVNDYEGAVVYSEPLTIFREHGMRRLVSLIWRRHKEQAVFRRANHLLFNSAACRDLNEREYGPFSVDARVIHKSIKDDLFKRPEREMNDPLPDRPKENRFLFVGSNWPTKGLPVILQSLTTLYQQGLDFSLVVVGATDFPANRRLMERSKDLFPEGRLLFTGRKKPAEIAELMWSSDYFVLPSQREALGIAIIEAMTASMVVFASHVGGIPEIISHGENGLLFDRTRPDDLTCLIRNVLDDPDLQSRLRANAVRRAETFSRSEMIRKVRAFYSNPSAHGL